MLSTAKAIENSEDDIDSHAALEYGGYDGHGLEDIDDEAPSKIRRIWWYVGWILVAIFVLGALVPFL